MGNIINALKANKRIRTNDHSQLLLFDPWEYLSLKRKVFFDQSWSELFRNEIFRQPPVKEVKTSFSTTFCPEFIKVVKIHFSHKSLGILGPQHHHSSG